MLVLSRRAGQEIDIGAHVKVLVVSIAPGKVRLAITAPIEIPVNRAEITARIQTEKIPSPSREPCNERLF